MKNLIEKTEYEVYKEMYFGIGLGIMQIEGRILVILPFVTILFVPVKVFK